MSILTGYKRVKNWVLTSGGYKLLSRWTSANSVEFDDGKTLESKLGNINGIVKAIDELNTTTDNSLVPSATSVREGLSSLKQELVNNVDASLNGASTNPIQNKTVKQAVDNISSTLSTKADTSTLNSLNAEVNKKADKSALGTQVTFALSGTTLYINTK